METFMGHLISGKSYLVPLIDRLNQYPVGLVDHEKLREILTLLFSEQEAYIASCFPLEEATLDELVSATGINADELQKHLEQMADKGLLMDMPCGDTTYWLLLPGVIGFFEYTFMKKRTDLPMAEVAQLMREYLFDVGQAKELFGSETQLTRALAYEDKIPATSQVTPWEDARRIVKNAEFGAVGMCFCRHQKEHLEQPCTKNAPMEGICIALGEGARFLVRRGFMEKKSTEELLAILDTARSFNLTHITDNIREEPSFICNCCSCCCELLAGVHKGFIGGIAKAPFLAQVDEETCLLCGQCIEACNARCIQMKEDKSEIRVDTKVCLGCGACIDSCPQNALTLTERPQRHNPPLNHEEMFERIGKEKG